MRPFAVAVALAALALPAEARAGTVTGSQRVDPAGSQLWASFEDGAGEANDLTVMTARGVIRFRDTLPIEVRGEACRNLTPTEVLCELPGALQTAQVDTGGGNDRLATNVSADLGAGDDVATLIGKAPVTVGPATPRRLGGEEGDDVLVGSPGDDQLRGGGGADVLRGEGGDDAVAATDGRQGPVRDVVDGGTGHDVVSYGGPAPVRVDLSAPAAGEDDLRGVEGVSGGSGDDVLIGSAGVDALFGALGDDRLEGRGGPDLLTGGVGSDVLLGEAGADEVFGSSDADVVRGGTGNDLVQGGSGDDEVAGESGGDRVSGGEGFDVLSGGAGEDLLDAVDRTRDLLRCGGGSDAAVLTRGDGVGPSCERPRVRRIRRVLASSRRRRGRKVVEVRPNGSLGLSITCDQGLQFACAGTAAVRVGGRRVARGRFACDDFFNGCRYEELDLRLPLSVRRRARRDRWIGAAVVVRFGRHGLPVVERVWLRRVR